MADAERAFRGHGGSHPSDPAIGLALFLASLIYFSTTLHISLELRDEGYLLYSIGRVAHGEIPHRDFAEAYGPGFYALTAPIFQIFGERIFPIRILLALVRAASVALAYLIARRLVPRSFALLAALLATVYWGRVFGNLYTPYAAMFTIALCMLSLVLFLRGQIEARRSAYLWSGLACGGALLFKWSLAAMSAYGMALAICASSMLREPRPEGPRTLVYPVLLIWVSMGMLVVVPFVFTLTPWDYFLHLAPIHAVIALIAIRFARFGNGRSALGHAFPLLIRYGAGFLILPICVGALYLWWGSLDDLLYNMVSRPLRVQNYPLAIRIPKLANILHLICLASWIGAGLALLRGRRWTAASFAALGCILAPAAYPALAPHWNPSLALQSLMLPQLAILSFVTLAFLAVFLTKPRPTDSEPCLNALIAVLLFQEMMTFQIFPRASYNVMLMLGTLTPVIGWISYRMYAYAMAGETMRPAGRRVTAFVLSASLPLLLVGEVGYSTIASAMAPEERALHSPALAGIHPAQYSFAPGKIQHFDELLEYLETAQPLDAPVFSVASEGMIYFASGRDHLFEDYAMALFLAGWDFLPEEDPATPSAEAMIRRLEATPEAIVILRPGDRTQARFAVHFPAVSRFIERRYCVEKRIGDYRVMRLELAESDPSRGGGEAPLRQPRSGHTPRPGSNERRSLEACPSEPRPT